MRLFDDLGARTVSPRVLGNMRALVGVVAVAKSLILLDLAPRMLGPDALRVPWIFGLPQLDAQTVQIALVVWLVAAVAFLIGWQFRAAALLLAASIAVVLSSDQHFFQNHVYLLLLLVILLGFSAADGALSVSQRGGAAPQHVPGWPVTLIQWQVSIVYLFGALSKLNIDYLSGATTAGAWLNGATGSWLVGVAGSAGMITFSVASVVLELWLAFSLLSQTRRLAAIVVGVLFHLGLIVTIPERADLTIFSLLMFTAYLPPTAPSTTASRSAV